MPNNTDDQCRIAKDVEGEHTLLVHMMIAEEGIVVTNSREVDRLWLKDLKYSLTSCARTDLPPKQSYNRWKTNRMTTGFEKSGISLP